MKEKTTQEILDQLLSRLGCNQSNPITTIHTNWIEIVGPDLALHASLIDVRNGVLIVETDHSTWSSLLLMKKKQILARLKAQFPELSITQIQTRVTNT